MMITGAQFLLQVGSVSPSPSLSCFKINPKDKNDEANPYNYHHYRKRRWRSCCCCCCSLSMLSSRFHYSHHSTGLLLSNFIVAAAAAAATAIHSPGPSTTRSGCTITTSMNTRHKKNRYGKPMTRICCRSDSGYAHDHDFLPASLLLTETVSHYRMRRQAGGGGLKDEMITSTLGHGFLRRFHGPTIFLKVSCDQDFLLPIIVGEFALEKLIESLQADDYGDSPDHYQFLSNVVGRLGYQVKMVRVTERAVNTYFARICFGKLDQNEILTVDARPSDAINVAIRCGAPIYISKQIVFADAIRIGFGTGGLRDAKITYDVSLDSAADGPDSISEELYLVRDMNQAIKEERYSDAAMLRDKITELRRLRDEH